MALNLFALRFDPRSVIHLHNDWAANNPLDPFDFKLIVPIPYSEPGIPPHHPTRGPDSCSPKADWAGHIYEHAPDRNWLCLSVFDCWIAVSRSDQGCPRKYAAGCLATTSPFSTHAPC